MRKKMKSDTRMWVVSGQSLLSKTVLQLPDMSRSSRHTFDFSRSRRTPTSTKSQIVDHKLPEPPNQESQEN